MNICIYGASSAELEQIYYDKTEELGRLCVSLLEDRRKLDAMAQAIERLRIKGAAEKICDYMRQRAGK